MGRQFGFEFIQRLQVMGGRLHRAGLDHRQKRPAVMPVFVGGEKDVAAMQALVPGAHHDAFRLPGTFQVLLGLGSKLFSERHDKPLRYPPQPRITAQDYNGSPARMLFSQKPVPPEVPMRLAAVSFWSLSGR